VGRAAGSVVRLLEGCEPIFDLYANWLTAGIDVPFAPGPNTLSETALGPIFSVSDLAVGFFWDSPFIITTSTRRPGG